MQAFNETMIAVRTVSRPRVNMWIGGRPRDDEFLEDLPAKIDRLTDPMPVRVKTRKTVEGKEDGGLKLPAAFAKTVR